MNGKNYSTNDFFLNIFDSIDGRLLFKGLRRDMFRFEDLSLHDW